MAEASLSFIGLGVTPPTPSWGLMVNNAGMAVTDGHGREVVVQVQVAVSVDVDKVRAFAARGKDRVRLKMERRPGQPGREHPPRTFCGLPGTLEHDDETLTFPVRVSCRTAASREAFAARRRRHSVMNLLIATGHALVVARHTSRWSVEEHLRGRSPECVAVDPHDPSRVYCGTQGNGLWRSDDAARTWEPVGQGIAHREITAVAVSPVERGRRFGIVYAGTEPSKVFRSDDGGETWSELSGLLMLRSAPTWSFPPRPHTHHVRWIESDPAAAGRVFVAIEAGALVRTLDGGRTWVDRVPGGPYDTHTAATHRLAPGRVYSAAGDGYFESGDAGGGWTRHVDGLRHRYLVGVGVDPADPDTAIVSAADGPWVAYGPENAEAHVYRKTTRHPWEPAMHGLPDARGTTVSRFATHPDEPGAVYLANNRGVYRSADAGRTWKALEISSPRRTLADGVEALACLPK